MVERIIPILINEGKGQATVAVSNLHKTPNQNKTS
jgi:hypothetical protein